jgi:hypothetical protein
MYRYFMAGIQVVAKDKDGNIKQNYASRKFVDGNPDVPKEIPQAEKNKEKQKKK